MKIQKENFMCHNLTNISYKSQEVSDNKLYSGKKHNLSSVKHKNKYKLSRKKILKDSLKKMSPLAAKILMAYSFYGSMFKNVYVSDGKIAKQVGSYREKTNIIKNHTLKKFGLITVKNRGSNRTCITKVNFNILNDIDLILYFMDEIKSLAGVFGYHITRFLKISHQTIINRVFSSSSRDKNIKVLFQLENVLNKYRDLPEYFNKLPLVEKICLSVFPVSAIEYAFDKISTYKVVIKNRLSLLRYLALYYVKLYDLSSLIHLSDWLYRICLKYAVNTKFFKNINNPIFNRKKKSMIGVSLLKSVAPKGVGCKRKQTPHMQKNLKVKELGPRGMDFMEFIKSECC